MIISQNKLRCFYRQIWWSIFDRFESAPVNWSAEHCLSGKTRIENLELFGVQSLHTKQLNQPLNTCLYHQVTIFGSLIFTHSLIQTRVDATYFNEYLFFKCEIKMDRKITCDCLLCSRLWCNHKSPWKQRHSLNNCGLWKLLYERIRFN